jgi:hypothetical protein
VQTITPALAEILKSHLQAGATAHHGRIRLAGQIYYPTSISIDHSLQAFASQLTAVFTNEAGEVGLSEDAFPENALFTAEQWYGEEENAKTTFTGFIDKVAEHRDNRTVTIIGRDWTKPLLVQDILVTAPQKADETGAVRTPANGVYLNMEISEIVKDLLTRAGYPLGQRAIQPTNFVVDEYLARDGASYADAISELAEPVAFNAFADELGIFKFQPDGLADSTTDDPPTPVYTFRTGEDILALDPVRDDYETKTRVRATGPYTTLKDAWTELWHTNVIKNPTGVWYEPGDPTHLNVADGPLRKIYRITQGEDATIVSSRNLSGVITYLNGLSGDPDDATIYWTFDTPWIAGGSSVNNKIRKHLKSDNSVLATFTLANQRWTDMKVGDDAIWATNFSTGKVHKLSKTDGSEIANYALAGHTQPIGVAIDGTDLFLSFYAEATMLQVDTSAPTVIVRTLHFSGTKSLGGDVDTDTHTELYACSGGLSLVYKYTLKEPVTNDVSVEAVNDELEVLLGTELDTGRQIRRLRIDLKMITSYAQATEAAVRRLDKLDQFRNVLDVGIIGNPALEKGDMVRIIDPLSVIDGEFQVDTYRSLQNDTYLGTLSLVPWTSSYAGPGDVPLPDAPGAPSSAQASGSRTFGTTGASNVGTVSSGDTLYAVIFDITKGAAGQVAKWAPGGLFTGTQEPFTKIDETELTTGGHTWYLTVWKIDNPTPSSVGRVNISGLTGAEACWGAWRVVGATTEYVVFDDGSGTGSSIATGAGASDLVLDCVGWYFNGTYPQPDPTSGQSIDFRLAGSGAGGGQIDVGWGGGHLVAEDPATWDLNVSRVWLGCAIVVSG